MGAKHGSVTIIMVGLLWLTGIVTAVLYAMTAHISTLVTMRELQTRYWYALQGGMVTALAHINEKADAYFQNTGSANLYEGLWLVDPRHPALSIELQFTRQEVEDRGNLHGTLFDENTLRISLLWHLFYDKERQLWCYQYGQQVYAE